VNVKKVPLVAIDLSSDDTAIWHIAIPAEEPSSASETESPSTLAFDAEIPRSMATN
jgi:hypothetical protein